MRSEPPWARGGEVEAQQGRLCREEAREWVGSVVWYDGGFDGNAIIKVSMKISSKLTNLTMQCSIVTEWKNEDVACGVCKRTKRWFEKSGKLFASVHGTFIKLVSSDEKNMSAFLEG